MVQLFGGIPELQGAGIQSQVGLAQVVRDIIGYNPTIQGNPDYIRLGDQLALPADWIRALQPSTEFPTIDAIVVIVTPVAPFLPPGVLKTGCLPGCNEESLSTPIPQWRDNLSVLGEVIGSPAVDHLDTILDTWTEQGLIPPGYGGVYDFVAQLIQDANVNMCLLNRGARGGVVAFEQAAVGSASVYVAGHCGMGLGTAAMGVTGGNLGMFGGGYVVGWGAGYLGSYHVMMIGVDALNKDVLFPWLEDQLCK